MKTSSFLSVLSWIPLVLLGVAVLSLGGMFFAGGMTRITAWYLAQMVLPLFGLVGLLFAVIRLVVRRSPDVVVMVTGLVSILAFLPGVMLFYPLPYPSDLASTTPAATVRLPANAPLKVAWGGDTQDVNYHVVSPDQRWAYDFLVDPYVNGSTELTDYGCYGVPVVAPADGLITGVRNDQPDMTPGITSNNFEAPTGNHVFIQLDQTGTYLVIAHLKPGSVVVEAGERVSEGQVIAECGNSGNTSEPHIHIHHQRQDPSVFPLNFAEGLPLYFRDHDGDPMPTGGFEMDGDQPVMLGGVVTHKE